jgi:hypothetical protein
MGEIAMPDKPKPLKRRDGLPLTFAGLSERWKDGMLSCTIRSILPAHCYSIKLYLVEINAHRFPYYVFARQPRQPWQLPLKSFDINVLTVAGGLHRLATLATS